MTGEFLPPVVTILEGDISDLVAKVAEAKALIDSISSSKIEIRVSTTGIAGPIAGAIAQVEALKAAMAGLDSKVVTVGAIAPPAAGGGRGGRGGWFGWLTNQVPLFGGPGADNNPGWLSKLPAWITQISAWHFALDAVAETLAVVIPSVIALGVWGAVAAGPIGDLKTQLTNMNTVAQATGQNIGPLNGSLGKLQDAVQPQVYQLFGDALSVAAKKAGTLQQMATGAGRVLDQLGARMALALQSGGMSKFLKDSSLDLSMLGNSIGNLFGIFGNFLKTLPGYAQGVLGVFQSVTHGIEVVTATGPVQRLMGIGLAFHGAFLWGGLFANLLGSRVSGLLTRVSGAALNLGARVSTLGKAGAAAGEGLLTLAGGAETAAALPWGWIVAAAAGFGILGYQILTAKDQMQSFVAGVNGKIGQTNAADGLHAIALGISAVKAQLVTLGPAAQYQPWNQVDYQAATGELRNLTQQQALYNQRIGQMAGMYGGVKAAQGMLTAAGITTGQFLSKNASTWAQVKQEVYATSLAYQQLGQKGGTLGADMFILNQQASDQYKAVTQLNQAWTTFLGLSTGIIGGVNGLITGMGTLAKQGKAAHATFTGVNTASITLQNSFESQISTLQGVIGGMIQAHASTKAMASVIATSLNPAVKDGALKNAALRQQIYDMAIEAGATPAQLSNLKKWLDANAGSAQHMANEVRGVGAALAAIPNLTVKRIQWQVSQSGTAPVNVGMPRAPNTYASGTSGAQPGWAWVGERGPELIRMAGGETVVPSHVARGYAAGTGGAAAMPEVHIYLDGKEISANVRRNTYQYNASNGNRRRGGGPAGVMVPRGH